MVNRLLTSTELIRKDMSWWCAGVERTMETNVTVLDGGGNGGFLGCGGQGRSGFTYRWSWSNERKSTLEGMHWKTILFMRTQTLVNDSYFYRNNVVCPYKSTPIVFACFQV